jgi:signal recognition particle subunit SRP19
MGRFRVMIKKADGTFVNGAIKNKTQLLLAICDAVNKIPGRAANTKVAASALAASVHRKKGKRKKEKEMK